MACSALSWTSRASFFRLKIQSKSYVALGKNLRTVITDSQPRLHQGYILEKMEGEMGRLLREAVRIDIVNIGISPAQSLHGMHSGCQVS